MGLRNYLRRNLQQLGGQFQAFVRQGANDLHNAVVPAFPTSPRGVDQPGTPLQPTQMATNQDLGIMGRGTLDQRIEAQSVRPPAPDRGRGVDI